MFKKIMIILIFLLLAIGVASAHDDKAYSSIDINDIKLPNDFNKTGVHSAIKDNIHLMVVGYADADYGRYYESIANTLHIDIGKISNYMDDGLKLTGSLEIVKINDKKALIDVYVINNNTFNDGGKILSQINELNNLAPIKPSAN